MATPVVSLHRLLLIVVSLLGLFGFSLASVQAEDREVRVEPRQAARRVALVIGNGAYVHVGHLVNPINKQRRWLSFSTMLDLQRSRRRPI